MKETAKQILARDMEYVAQIFPDPKPVVAMEGKGCILKTADGEEYLDLMSGVAVTSTGHSHPRVLEAICQQAGKVIHANCFGNYAYDIQSELGQLIADRVYVSGNTDYTVDFTGYVGTSGTGTIRLTE